MQDEGGQSAPICRFCCSHFQVDGLMLNHQSDLENRFILHVNNAGKLDCTDQQEVHFQSKLALCLGPMAHACLSFEACAVAKGCGSASEVVDETRTCWVPPRPALASKMACRRNPAVKRRNFLFPRCDDVKVSDTD